MIVFHELVLCPEGWLNFKKWLSVIFSKLGKNSDYVSYLKK